MQKKKYLNSLYKNSYSLLANQKRLVVYENEKAKKKTTKKKYGF